MRNAEEIAELLDNLDDYSGQGCMASEAADEIRSLIAALNSAEERSKACDQIADGDYGWEKLEPLCVSTMSVARLRSNYEFVSVKLREARRALQRIVASYDGRTNTKEMAEIARTALVLVTFSEPPSS